jgi:chromosome segregation ATPase
MVISALGSNSKSQHINFRDSKLTRLLQPSLSGNAKMAIICCTTPSELYLEETRSTLLFAKRAKLVKTKPIVNEVLDANSMIKKLQKELARAKKAGGGEKALQHLKSLESEAAKAETSAKRAEAKLQKLKASILRGGFLRRPIQGNMKKRQSSNMFAMMTSPQRQHYHYRLANITVENANIKKRRVSEGQAFMPLEPLTETTNLIGPIASPVSNVSLQAPKSDERHSSKVFKRNEEFQVKLLKDALSAKGELARDLNDKLSKSYKETELDKMNLDEAKIQIEELKKLNDQAREHINTLVLERNKFIQEQQHMVDNHNNLLKEKQMELYNAEKQVEEHQCNVAKEVELNAVLQHDKTVLEDELASTNDVVAKVRNEKGEIEALLQKEKEINEEVTQVNQNMEQQMNRISASMSQLKASIANGQSETLEDISKANQTLEEKMTQLSILVPQLMADVVNGHNVTEHLEAQRALAEALAAQMSETEDDALLQIQNLVIELAKAQYSLGEVDKEQHELINMKDRLDTENCELKNNIEALRDQNKILSNSNQSLEEQLTCLSNVVSQLKTDIANGHDVTADLDSQRALAEALAAQMSETEDAALANVQGLVVELGKVQSSLSEAQAENDELNRSNQSLEEQLTCLSNVVSQLKTDIANGHDVTADLDSQRALAEALAAQMSETEDAALANVQGLLTELNNLVSRQNEIVNDNSVLQKNITKLSAQIELYEGGEHESLQSLISQLAEEKGKLSKAVELLEQTSHKLSMREKEIDVLRNDFDTQAVKLHDVEVALVNRSKDVSQLSSDLSCSRGNCTNLQNEIECLSSKVNSLKEESEKSSRELSLKSSLLDDKDNELAASNNELEEIHGKIRKYERIDQENMEAIEVKLCQLQAAEKRVKELESDIASVQSNLDTVQNDYEQLRVTHASKENECNRSTNNSTALQSQIEEASMQLDIERQKLSDAYKELDLKKKEINDMSSQDNADVECSTKAQSLEAEVLELKQLLADTMKREEVADQELEEKEIEHEHLEKFAAERDAMVKQLEQKITHLESQLLQSSSSLPQNYEIEELLKEMELLLEEKQAIEEMLQNERHKWQLREKEVKKLAGDEQRLLIQEAEGKMSSLREELKFVSDELEKQRNDTQLTRKKLAMVEDNVISNQNTSTSLQSVNASLQEKLTTAEETTTNLLLQLSQVQKEYEDCKNYVQFQKESLQESHDKKLTNMKSELSGLHDSMSKEQSRSKAVLREYHQKELDFRTLKEEMGNKDIVIEEKEFEVGKLKEEIATIRLTSSRLEAEHFEMKHNLDEMKGRYKKMKEKVQKSESSKSSQETKTLVREQQQTLIANKEEIQLLQTKVDDLMQNMKSKDERMKELKRKVLTKDQVKDIKKLQVCSTILECF